MAGAGLTGFLQNLSGGEMIVIVIVALVVLGPERLPDLARSAGRTVHKLKTLSENLQSEMGDVMDDPSMQPLKELGEFAARPRQKLSEYAAEAAAEDRSRRAAAAHAAHQAAIAAAEGYEEAEDEDDEAEQADEVVRAAAALSAVQPAEPQDETPLTHDVAHDEPDDVTTVDDDRPPVDDQDPA